jgi:hypothetical protein
VCMIPLFIASIVSLWRGDMNSCKFF